MRACVNLGAARFLSVESHLTLENKGKTHSGNK